MPQIALHSLKILKYLIYTLVGHIELSFILCGHNTFFKIFTLL
jgi:hypothetical protein